MQSNSTNPAIGQRRTAMTASETLAAVPSALHDSEELYEVVDGKRVPKTAAVLLDDSDLLYEVVHGKRVELPPMGARETHLLSNLFVALGSFVMARRFGRAEAEMLFLLDAATDLRRRPDAAFVSYERWPRERPVPATAAWQVVPNLAIEVVSPTNTALELLDKVSDYFQTGVQRVWVVFPNQELVYVYNSPTSIRVLERSGELDGEEVLPGFRLPLSDLFEQEPAEAQAP
jgi:Uma2 family endonuclease